MNRKLVVLITMLVMVFNLFGSPAFANSPLIPISGAVLNDQLSFKLNGLGAVPVGDDGTPVLPISFNGTTYLPLKAIGYLLGLGINFEGATKTVLISSTSTGTAPTATHTPKTNTLIPISNVVLNNQLKFKLNNVPVIPVGDDGTPVLPISFNGTTYLPIKAIGYLLGLNVSFEIPTKTVFIARTDATQTPPITQAPTPTVTQAPAPANAPGWYFKEYAFRDSSGKYQADVYSFTGEKNNMTMSHNRYDNKGGLVVGVTVQTIWSDPPNFIKKVIWLLSPMRQNN